MKNKDELVEVNIAKLDKNQLQYVAALYDKALELACRQLLDNRTKDGKVKLDENQCKSKTTELKKFFVNYATHYLK